MNPGQWSPLWEQSSGQAWHKQALQELDFEKAGDLQAHGRVFRLPGSWKTKAWPLTSSWCTGVAPCTAPCLSLHICRACFWWWCCRMLDCLLLHCLLPGSGRIMLENLHAPTKPFSFHLRVHEACSRSRKSCLAEGPAPAHAAWCRPLPQPRQESA